MKLNYSKIYDLVFFKLILLFLIIFPFLFSYFRPSNNVFELVKSVYLWPAALLFLALYLIKYILFDNKIEIKFKKSELLIFLFLFLLLFLYLLNTFFVAPDSVLAVYGDYNRRYGLYSYISFLIFFFLIFKSFKKYFDFKLKYLLIAFTLAGFFVSVYGFFQYIGFAFQGWHEPVFAFRIISTLGQPNFLASFLILTLGTSFSLYFLKNNFYFKLFSLISIYFHILAIYLTSSRGAWFSLFIIIFIYFFIYLKKWKSRLLYLLLLILFSLSLFFSGFYGDRISSTFDFDSGSSSARLEFYQAGILAISDKMFFGYGIEQLSSTFAYYYDSNWALFLQVNDFPDRAHNIILDLLLYFGLVGFLLYLIVFIYLAKVFIKIIKENNKELKFIVFALITYFISLLFNFSSLATTLYSLVLLAILLAYFINNKDDTLYIFKVRKKIIFSLVSFLIILNIYSLFYIVNLNKKTLIADNLFLYCKADLLNNNLAGQNLCWEAIYLAEDEVIRAYYLNYLINYSVDNYNSFNYDFRQKIINYFNTNYLLIKDDNYNSYLSKTRLACLLNKHDYQTRFTKVISLSPKRPYVYKIYGHCNFLQENYLDAILNYELALKYLPNLDNKSLNNQHKSYIKYYKYLLFYAKAQSYLALDDKKLAIYYFKRAYHNYPRNINAYYKIAELNLELNNYKEAIENYLKIWRYNNNHSLLEIIANLYLEIDKKDMYDYYILKFNNYIN